MIFFFGFLQFLLGFSKVLVFLCHPVLAAYAVVQRNLFGNTSEFLRVCSELRRVQLSVWI